MIFVVTESQNLTEHSFNQMLKIIQMTATLLHQPNVDFIYWLYCDFSLTLTEEWSNTTHTYTHHCCAKRGLPDLDQYNSSTCTLNNIYTIRIFVRCPVQISRTKRNWQMRNMNQYILQYVQCTFVNLMLDFLVPDPKNHLSFLMLLLISHVCLFSL